MCKKSIFYFLSIILFTFESLETQAQWFDDEPEIRVGAERMPKYLPFIKSRNIGVVANHTSIVSDHHLVDTLLKRRIRIKKIFSPEHGFRGEGEAGQIIDGGIDAETKIPVISLYGTNKKPTQAQLEGLAVLVFDMQDVGARFYTYISTLHLVMEACAEKGIKLVVLDRPNPNGDYVAGPILKSSYKSFVGMDPLPVVHGMTIGELAKMFNEEGWLKNSAGNTVRCNLEVIPCLGYDHSMIYEPPVNPSPNLPNLQAIRLYPSLCLFEGTVFSVGRGTPYPFQVYGHPNFRGDFSFTPKSIPGKATNPKFRGQKCHGKDLRDEEAPQFTLKYLWEAYRLYPDKDKFFTGYFQKLIGNGTVQSWIESGKDYEEVEKTWQIELMEFKKLRKKYLLYPEGPADE